MFGEVPWVLLPPSRWSGAVVRGLGARPGSWGQVCLGDQQVNTGREPGGLGSVGGSASLRPREEGLRVSAGTVIFVPPEKGIRVSVGE